MFNTLCTKNMSIAKRIQALIAAIVMSASITSCSSTEEYKAFAQSGIDYADSLNELIKCSGKVSIDSSSYQAFQDDSIVNYDLNRYIARKEKDERRLELLNQLRDQIFLLRRYFSLIQQLASVGDTTPQAIGSEITNIANDLTSIKAKFLVDSNFPTSEFNDAAGKLVAWAISSEIKGAIRKELQSREITLKESLLIHTILVKKLIEEDLTDLSIIKNFLENKEVIQPLISKEPKESWIKKREEIIKIQKLMWNLNSQSTISDDFSQTLKEIVEDRANLTRSQYLSQKANTSKVVFSSLCTYDSYAQALLFKDQRLSSN
jgi:hypothetical protein